MQWRGKKKIKTLSEPVFLAYFSELSEIQVPSSVWATYSMLRSTIQAKHNINIHDYAQVIQFLKKNSKGYEVKFLLLIIFNYNCKIITI